MEHAAQMTLLGRDAAHACIRPQQIHKCGFAASSLNVDHAAMYVEECIGTPRFEPCAPHCIRLWVQYRRQGTGWNRKGGQYQTLEARCEGDEIDVLDPAIRHGVDK